MPSRWGGVVLAAALLGAAGCGEGGLKTYPVRGTVVLAGGDVKQLADCHVELVHETDPDARPSGLIGPDGRFEVQTLYKGKTLNGAPEGSYKARIILASSDDGERPKRPGRPVHARFLDANTSGLTYKVPADGEITVNLSAK